MTSNTRLRVCGLMIILSAVYAIVVVQNPELASAIASGYVALLLTAITLLNVWKKP